MLPPVLADVNVAPAVVAFLRAEGCDVVAVEEMGWANRLDEELLAHAHGMRRFLLTHDADFGRLAIAEGKPNHGIIRLRPGGDRPATVIAGLDALLRMEVEWRPGTLAVFLRGRLRMRRHAR